MRLTLSLLLLPLTAFAQLHEGRQLVQASLVADTAAIAPGQPFTVGVRLQMAPGWHTYWHYSGDAGLPTRLEWKLPDGFTAGAIRWPIPEHHMEPGDIQTYGYSGETMLLVEITPPQKIGAKKVTLAVKADWLVCEKICIPGGEELALELPVGEAAPAEAALFQKYRAQLPQPLPEGVKTEWSFDDASAVLRVEGLSPAQAERAEFYPLPAKGMTLDHPERLEGEPAAIRIPGNARKPIDGVLIVPDGEGRAGWQIGSGGERSPDATAATPTSQGGSFWHYIGLGFLGGIILNLMPCVLPVIALKLFGFIKQAGEEPGRVFRIGLAFSAGVFAFFFAMAALMSAFQMAGRELNWAFQFQSPWFVLGLSVLVFVFGLNLLGVFEVYLPEKAGSAALDLSRREGYRGAFLHGAFATLLGTSCTAPLLAPALGFALAQPPAGIFAIFGAIAAGMSLPYILLTARPGWLRYLPKPGPWMEHAKQFMGFLMLATLLFLLWVIGRQRGADGIIYAGAFLLVLGVAAWVKGVFGSPLATRGARTASWVVIVALVAAGWFGFITNGFAQLSAPKTESFQAKLDAALAKDRPVFVDFTADWCLNCKVNERVVLQSKAVQEAFAEHDVIFLVADWTNGDPEITTLLRRFGRAGVPLYVFYPAGGGAPVVLPEVLTKQMVINTVAHSASSESL